MLSAKEKEAEKQMSRWRYVMTSTETDIDGGENVRYTTYGVKAFDSEGNVATVYPDVSTKKALVEEIVEKCNLYNADVIHLEDILLDCLD